MSAQGRGDRPTAVEVERNRRFRRRLALLAAAVAAVLAIVGFRYSPNRPVRYADDAEHFKYGSIGSDVENGLPLAILQVLPRAFPEYLPTGAPRDYRAFGFIYEPGHSLPIGFSQRRRIIDVAGLNCAACHVGSVRASPTATATHIVGMPSNTVDLHAFFDFLFRCAQDERFTPDYLLPQIAGERALPPWERFIYAGAVTGMRAGLLVRKGQLDGFLGGGHPRFGPGRVDTFNPYKMNQFAARYRGGIPDVERYGTSDFPAVWNQRIRRGMNLHWDGNNASVRERNFSAAFGAGATREHVDAAAIDRVGAWLDDLPAPKYPFPSSADPKVVAAGQGLYQHYCAGCHEPGSPGVGRVVAIAEIRTDRNRLDSYTQQLATLQAAYGEGYPWQMRHFRKTDGYANQPLDGVWARAPYLHNGSVPTLYDLLTPEAERNGGSDFFYVGHGVYDQEKVGFRTDVAAVDGRPSFRYVISERGNGNQGHSGERYGTSLSAEQKAALIEYLKTK
jgi:hypothetical protein